MWPRGESPGETVAAWVWSLAQAAPAIKAGMTGCGATAAGCRPLGDKGNFSRTVPSDPPQLTQTFFPLEETGRLGQDL